MLVPKKLFMSRGVGYHQEKLTSFEMALRNAGIASFNLVRVSSIFPPHCRILTKDRGLEELVPGQVVFSVISKNTTSTPNQPIVASIGLARPRDPNMYGYLSEHQGFEQTEQVAGSYAEDLAAEMLATSLGVSFDPDQSWDKKREMWEISGKIVETTSTTQFAVGNCNGKWTTVIATAILLL